MSEFETHLTTKGYTLINDISILQFYLRLAQALSCQTLISIWFPEGRNFNAVYLPLMGKPSTPSFRTVLMSDKFSPIIVSNCLDTIKVLRFFVIGFNGLIESIAVKHACHF